ncbi:sulfurtransferase [Fulvivirgaceae bacterium PWU4]|uniref:Sulfurtransferase n=1 Tax=Chryseosolibacter histidini TaxID=2782349 RepID=A0AAP2DQF5_9BACT|nr:sulfurtransferase [Chryseosolibacter histidini]MBT1700608.1 sulfurtransferase [Chryseosolibacter histidini]
MTETNTPLIPANELQDVLNKKNAVIIDARSGPDAYARYQAGHAAGAIHVDLDRDLSEKPENAAVGGRHPLPDVKKFAALLGRLGITPSSHVIVYDDKNGANAAARFWWMLKAAGHERVQVVDGGLDGIIRQGIRLDNAVPVPTASSPYPFDAWKRPVADINKVADAAADPNYLVIDVREAYRYLGEREPIDLTAGHIPGAVNIPYIDNLDKDGNFRSSAELASKYKAAMEERKPQQVIVHCGSGVTACHTLLALEHAGIKGAQLYVGSWSEWSRTGRPIATGSGSGLTG